MNLTTLPLILYLHSDLFYNDHIRLDNIKEKCVKKVLFLAMLLLILFGCVNKDFDPYNAYRSETSIELFINGERALEKKDYSEAVKNFEALDSLYPFSPYATQAQLDVIYAYYKNGATAAAIGAADRYIRLYPRGQNVDYAYYMRGVIYFDVGLSWLQKLALVNPVTRDVSTTLQQSFVAFTALTETLPYSHYTPDALTRMCYIRNLMAQREVIIAEFYMKRCSYIAAVNRATYVFQHFEGSPQVVKALVIMVKAYRALGLTKMADASELLLLQIHHLSSRIMKE